MNHDERIDRVLRALGESEPPPEMERRLAQAVEQRLAQGTGGTSWLRAPRLRAGAAGVVCVLAMMVTMPVLKKRAATAVHRELRAGTVPAPAPRSRERTEVSGPETKHGRTGTHTRPTGVSRSTAASSPSVASVARGDVDVADASYAPTRVAAPLPLTREERLLVRIARRGEAEQNATLHADVRDEQLVAEKREFEEYFKSPEPPKQDQ